MAGCKTDEAKEFYLRLTIANGWSFCREEAIKQYSFVSTFIKKAEFRCRNSAFCLVDWSELYNLVIRSEEVFFAGFGRGDLQVAIL